MSYTKLFSSIIHSTIWLESNHIRLVWVTMLAMSDQDGMVESMAPGIASAARVSLAECEEALATLSGPDERSRLRSFEGRRISLTPRGWLIHNHHWGADKKSAYWSRKHCGAALERDGRRCRYCSSSSHLSIDHVVPRCQGGGDELSNLVVACRSCNSRKGGRTPEQAGMVLH